MFQNIIDFFRYDSLSPHGICLIWNPGLMWAHAISDAAIGLAYFSIPIALARFVSKRKGLEFGWLLWCFVAFIMACGTTHFLSLITLWVPVYGIEAVIKMITATLSITTAIQLWPMIPVLLTIPSPAELEAAHEDRRRVEGLLLQAQKMETIGQLAGGIAHDFNNILTAIVLNLDRIERIAGKGAAAPNIAIAIQAVDRASNLSNKMLAFSSSRAVLGTKSQINACIEDLQPIMDAALGGNSILTLDLAKPPIDCAVDQSALQSALLNLIVNSKHALEDTNDGEVIVRTALRGLVPIIEVTDNGTGMSNDTISKAFEPFFTTKDIGKGTGLGLFQVYAFMKEAGGRVEIESKLGYGTTIRLIFGGADGSQNIGG